MGSTAKFGLLILMALVIALARFLEGEVKQTKSPPVLAVQSNAEQNQAQATSERQQANARPTDIRPQAQPAVVVPRSEPPANRSYKAKRRDNLSRIAKKFYGRSSEWRILLKANKRLLKNKPQNLREGMTLVIPPKPLRSRRR